MTINGWVRLERLGDSKTRIFLGGEFPGLDDSTAESIRPLMERSATNIKSLTETDS